MGLKRKKKDPDPEQWPEGLPKPYDEGRIIPLMNFLHGPELCERYEREREKRRKWMLKFLGVEDEENKF